MKYELGVFGAWSQGDDYEDGNGETVQSDFARGSIGANLGLKVAKNQLVKISATRNFASDADFAALAMDLRNDDTWLLNAKHEYNVNGDKLQSWKTSIYLTTVDHLKNYAGGNCSLLIVNCFQRFFGFVFFDNWIFGLIYFGRIYVNSSHFLIT